MSKSPFKVGDTVEQIMPAPVRGVIAEIGICSKEGERKFKVVWPDADGDGIEESRFFDEDQIKMVDAGAGKEISK